MKNYIFFTIVFLITALLYLHLKSQLHVLDTCSDIPYIDSELTREQFHTLCSKKSPFVYKYGVSEDEKIFEKEYLVSNDKHFEVNTCIPEKMSTSNTDTDETQTTSNSSSSHMNRINIDTLFSPDAVSHTGFDNGEFLKETGKYDILYRNDSFMRPNFTASFNYDMIVSQRCYNKEVNEKTPMAFQNKYYTHVIHCIENPIHFKLVLPKFSDFFVKTGTTTTNTDLFSNIDLFDEDSMKNDKHLSKIKVYDIVLQSGDALYIPPFWIYAYTPFNIKMEMIMNSDNTDETGTENKSNEDKGLEQCHSICVEYNYMTYMNAMVFIPNTLQHHSRKVRELSDSYFK